jgi:hypothetical protein
MRQVADSAGNTVSFAVHDAPLVNVSKEFVMNRKFEIGDQVYFVDGAVERAGEIVGAELVEGPYRPRPGWHYIIQAEPFEIIDLHERDIVSKVEPSAEPIAESVAWG